MWIRCCAALGLLATASVLSAEEGAPQEAVWQSKQLDFVYMGFTTRYSCDGLASQVKSVLLSLGARRDVVAYGTGCTVAFDRPAPFPGVRIRMNVLQPASWRTAVAGAAAPADGSRPGNQAGAGKGAGEAVPAHWKVVKLKLDSDPLSQAGECELIEQIKDKILPLFAARKVQFSSHCVPHQISPGSISLSAQVLMADRASDVSP